MDLEVALRDEVGRALAALFNHQPGQLQIQIQPTNPEFEGTHTLVCFSLTKISRQSAEDTARTVGNYLVANSALVCRYNVVKGFLNLSIADSVWVTALRSIVLDKHFGVTPRHGKELMVEYSSPNTNKPLHLGHLRNNFLGYAVASIFEAVGYTVHKVQIINDRGIHICKSMAAWLLAGQNETPESSGLKGDHLVGKYYVAFDKRYRAEVQALAAQGVPEAEAEKQAPVMQLAVELLRKWEDKDADTLALWKKMNGWVYHGFEATYRRMGVDFDKLYYESDTYLLGKEEVMKGVQQGIFYKKDDGSVWVDLSSDGLDQKVLLRADGTSVYITQDIGTAILRFRDFPKIEGQVYTVGNEQEYHFKVLFLILKKLGYAWADKCHHLSYGMVDLPTGRMKSREGTVVDADDLMDEMVAEAEKQTRELGKIEDAGEEQLRRLAEMIGIGALKYFLLKVDPKKRMLFDPNESIQLQGHTGPFIQYTYARICALLRKAGALQLADNWQQVDSLEAAEREVIAVLHRYPQRLQEAARDYSPAVVANYAYDLAKSFNQFYQTIPVLTAPDPARLALRLALAQAVASVLLRAMGLLGIRMPERM
jgi:arginyl-tRNA synthetase